MSKTVINVGLLVSRAGQEKHRPSFTCVKEALNIYLKCHNNFLGFTQTTVIRSGPNLILERQPARWQVDVMLSVVLQDCFPVCGTQAQLTLISFTCISPT